MCLLGTDASQIDFWSRLPWPLSSALRPIYTQPEACRCLQLFVLPYQACPGTVPISTLPGDFQGFLTQESPLPLLFLSDLKARHQDSVPVSLVHIMSVLVSLPSLLFPLSRVLSSITHMVPRPSPVLLSSVSHVAGRMMKSLHDEHFLIFHESARLLPSIIHF